MSSAATTSRHAQNIEKLRGLRRALHSLSSATGAPPESFSRPYVSSSYLAGDTPDFRDNVAGGGSAGSHSRPRQLTYGPTDESAASALPSALSPSDTFKQRYLSTAQREVERLTQEKHDLIQQCLNKDAAINNLEKLLAEAEQNHSQQRRSIPSSYPDGAPQTEVKHTDINKLIAAAQECFPSEATTTGVATALDDEKIPALCKFLSLVREKAHSEAQTAAKQWKTRESQLLDEIAAATAKIPAASATDDWEQQCKSLQDQLQTLQQEKQSDCQKLVEITERLAESYEVQKAAAQDHFCHMAEMEGKYKALQDALEETQSKLEDTNLKTAELQLEGQTARAQVAELEQKLSTTDENSKKQLLAAKEKLETAVQAEAVLKSEAVRLTTDRESLSKELASQAAALSLFELQIEEADARTSIVVEELLDLTESSNTLAAAHISMLATKIAAQPASGPIQSSADSKHLSPVPESSILVGGDDAGSLASQDMSVRSDTGGVNSPESDVRKTQQALNRSNRERIALKKKLDSRNAALSEAQEALVKAQLEIDRLNDKLAFTEGENDKLRTSAPPSPPPVTAVPVTDDSSSEAHASSAVLQLLDLSAVLSEVVCEEGTIVNFLVDWLCHNGSLRSLASAMEGQENNVICEKLQAQGYLVCLGRTLVKMLNLDQLEQIPDLERCNQFWSALFVQVQHRAQAIANVNNTPCKYYEAQLLAFPTVYQLLGPDSDREQLPRVEIAAAVCAVTLSLVPVADRRPIFEHVCQYAEIENESSQSLQKKTLSFFSDDGISASSFVDVFMSAKSQSVPNAATVLHIAVQIARLSVVVTETSFDIDAVVSIVFLPPSHPPKEQIARSLLHFLDAQVVPLVSIARFLFDDEGEQLLRGLLKNRSSLYNMLDSSSQSSLPSDSFISQYSDSIVNHLRDEQDEHSKSVSSITPWQNKDMEGCQRELLRLYKENSTYLSHIELLLSEIENK